MSSWIVYSEYRKEIKLKFRKKFFGKYVEKIPILINIENSPMGERPKNGGPQSPLGSHGIRRLYDHISQTSKSFF